MDAISDDEFDHVRDFDVSDIESEAESVSHDTPSTTPPRNRTPRPIGQKNISCPYHGCAKTFTRNARLQEHIRSHTGERPFKCQYCPKDFLRDSHLKHHLVSAHSNERKYICTWQGCEKSFATGTRLRRHVQSHECKEKYRCRGYPDCDKTFRKHETLRKHMLSVHENRKPFPCDRLSGKDGFPCTQAFDTADKLKSHQRNIHDETRFICTLCTASKAAQDAEALEDGMFAPEIVSFCSFAELQSHISEAHPPTCDYCPLSFTTTKELKRHQEVQHGMIDIDRATSIHYPCTYARCQHVFTKRGNLNVHIRTVHEQKKDFVCGLTEITAPDELDGQDIAIYGCGRPFTSKASLIEHVRTAHFNLPSKRTLRNERKRVKREVDEDDDAISMLSTGSKKRAIRKDKGMKKTSALSSLTGTPGHQARAEPTLLPPLTFSESAQVALSIDSQNSRAEDEDMDDWNQLSGSMTLFGSHLYHNGRGFHLDGDAVSAGSSVHEQSTYIPCDDAPSHLPEADNIFEFEHEPEIYHSMVDPCLLRT